MCLEVKTASVSVGNNMNQVTSELSNALRPVLPLTLMYVVKRAGFCSGSTDRSRNPAANAFSPCQIPFSVIAGLRKVEDENEAS